MAKPEIKIGILKVMLKYQGSEFTRRRHKRCSVGKWCPLFHQIESVYGVTPWPKINLVAFL